MVEFLIDNSSSSGLGLSVPGAPPGVNTALPPIPEPTGTIDPPKSRLPERFNNPLSKIGLLLQSVAAGAQGKPSPVAALLKEGQQEETNRLRAAQIQLQAAAQLSKLLEDVPFDKQKKFAKQFSDKFKLDSEISGALVSDPPVRQALTNIEPPLQPFLARIVGTPRTPAELEEARDLIKDPKTAETARRLFDHEMGQQVRPKLDTLAKLAQRTGFDPNEDNELSFQEIVDFNTQFLKGTELELDENALFYLRGGEGQRDLADRGITVSETVASAQKTGAETGARLDAEKARVEEPRVNSRGQLVQRDATGQDRVLDQEEAVSAVAVMQRDRAKAIAEGRTKDAQELGKRIEKAVTIVGRTESDVGVVQPSEADPAATIGTPEGLLPEATGPLQSRLSKAVNFLSGIVGAGPIDEDAEIASVELDDLRKQTIFMASAQFSSRGTPVFTQQILLKNMPEPGDTDTKAIRKASALVRSLDEGINRLKRRIPASPAKQRAGLQSQLDFIQTLQARWSRFAGFDVSEEAPEGMPAFRIEDGTLVPK